MPIKFPKIARRKSSGNALEDIDNNPETPSSSFRVFERPANNKSFDGPVNFRRTHAARPLSSPSQNFLDTSYPDNKILQITKNRTSAGTNHSASTGQFDSSSSARFSSSSTLPSSSDVSFVNDGNSFYPPPPNLKPPPIPSHAQGRPHSYAAPRDRASTSSTAETTIPRSYLDNELRLTDNDMADFGNMFDGFGDSRAKREPEPLRQTESPEPIRMPPAGRIPPVRERLNLPSINTDRSQPVEPSPYSWGRDSHTSGDGLMEARSPIQEAWATKRRKSSPSMDTNEDTKPGAVRGQANIYGRTADNMSPSDEGFRLNNNSSAFNNVRAPYQQTYVSDAGERQLKPVHLYDKAMDDDESAEHGWRQEQLQVAKSPLTDRQSSPQASIHDDVDETIVLHAALANQYEEAPPSPPRHTVIPSRKVMTPAEFQKYRQQKEDDSRRWSNYSPSEASSKGDEDHYDDEAEAENTRQMAKQRRQQEAHLTVYRQQMMKIAGEPASKTASDRAASTPNLPMSMSSVSLGDNKGLGKCSDEEEEDEDVPLGILAAHGFPNKNRPPMRLAQTSSNPNLRASMTYAGGVSVAPASTVGDSTLTARRSQLPAFARQLPRDPYLGAGLVNQTTRESLAMGGGSGQVGLPPGGLVGVIAEEERAKALRRASPNAQTAAQDPLGNFSSGRASTMMGNMAMPPVMGSMPSMVSPSEQAQMQMSQQMTQMMQMQMQWMQQMQQMWQMQGSQPQTPGATPTMPGQPQFQVGGGFLAPPGRDFQRPMTMGGPVQGESRAMSMLGPSSAGNWGQPAARNYLPSIRGMGSDLQIGGYAPSIAPSERSNIGLAPRYRPVSTAVDPASQQHQPQTFDRPHLANDRSQSFASGAYKPNGVISATIRAVSPERKALRPGNGNSNLKPVQAPNTRKANSSISDDDDDAGWAEMRRKREQKKGTKGLKNNSLLSFDRSEAAALDGLLAN